MKTSSFVFFSHLNLKAVNNTVSDEWMDARLDIFEAVTLESLRRQTDMDFLCLIAISDRTSKRHCERLDAMRPSNSEVVKVNECETNYPSKNNGLLLGDCGTKIMKSYLKPDKHGMVWTTKLDTDDAVSRDYVESMKNVYDFDHYRYHGFFCYSQGYVCYTHTSSIYEVSDSDYFFTTLREPIEIFRGAMYYPHSHAIRSSPVVMLPLSFPMWFKTIHDNQISNYKQWSKRWRLKWISDQPVVHGRVLKRFDVQTTWLDLCRS